MSVFKRGNQWCIGYSRNGKWVRKAIGTSKKLAMLAEKKIRLDIAKGEYLGIVESKKLLFEELCEEYLQFSKANKTPQSYRRDQTSIKNLLVVFKGKLITKISTYNLEHYMNNRRDKVTPATVNRELSCVKHMFNKAVQWGYLVDNPLRTVKKYKEPPGRTRFLSRDEISELLKCCAKYIRPIVILALYTGMRKGEILGLKWQNVDMRNRFVRIVNSKNNEMRIIPMNDILSSELKSLGQQPDNQHVFSHTDGRPYRDIKDGFKNATKRAKLTDVTFHTLRHTFASHLAIKGVPLLEIQKLLGHKTLAMTLRYSHLANRNLSQAVDKLDFTEYNGTEDRTYTA